MIIGRTSEGRYIDVTEHPEFYKEKLLEPGWTGELTYIKSQLKRSPSLKRRWGFYPSAKRLSEDHIRKVARDGLSAIKKPVSASAVREQKPFKQDKSNKGLDV